MLNTVYSKLFSLPTTRLEIDINTVYSIIMDFFLEPSNFSYVEGTRC